VLELSIVISNQDNLITLEEDFQIESAESFLTSLQQRLIPSKYLPDLLMATLGMFEFNSRAIDDAWIEVFEILLPQLPSEAILQKVVPFINNLGDYSQIINSRITAAICITRMARVLKTEFKDLLLAKILALAQDTSSEVRKTVCENLGAVCKALPIQVMIVQIFPEIVKLVKEEEPSVRSAGIKLFVEVLEDCPLELVKEKCLRVINDEVLNVTELECKMALSYSIGKLLQVLVKIAPGALMNRVMNLFYELSCVEEPEVRLNIAFNLPGIVQILGGLNEEIKQILNRLVEDENVDVRKKVAAGLHEIIRMQASPSHFLWQQVDKLLDSYDTFQLISPNLKEILTLLPSEKSNYSTKLFKQFCKDLTWRYTYDLLNSISNSFDLLDKSLLEQLPQILINFMKSSCQPLRMKSCEMYAELIRYLHIKEKKQQLCDYIKDHIPTSPSCFTRSIFIDFCMFIQKHHSKAFFEVHFADSLYKLANDSVANVRMKLASNLPKLREGIPDSHASTIFYRTMNTLLNDTDECVSEAAGDSQVIMMSKEYIAFLNSDQLKRNDMMKLQMEEQQDKRAEEEQEEARKRIFIEWEAKARKEAYSSKKKTGKARTPQLIITRKASSDIKKVPERPALEKKQIKVQRSSPVKNTKTIAKKK
jgi:hypothetical protein